jgi:hypothetical protein
MSAPTVIAAEFGFVAIEVVDGENVGCLGHNGVEALDDLSAAELRSLAADALAAAEWLEARSTTD